MPQLSSSPSLVRPVTLEGAHVRLEPLSFGHVEALVAAACEDRSNYQWTWVPDGLEAMTEYVSTALSAAEEGEAVPFATILRESGRIIGTTRFANFERHAWPETSPYFRRDGLPDGVEIGWTWLAASAQRSPANTEAKWLMLRHAFEVWQVRVVRLITDRRNERSRAAIERIGGKLDGVIRVNRAGADGAIRDSAIYSIVESEWPEIDSGLRARLVRD